MDDFAHAVAVIMRIPKLRDMPVADLEWLLLPALLAVNAALHFLKVVKLRGQYFHQRWCFGLACPTL